MARINRYPLKPPSKGFNKKIYPIEPVIYRIVNIINNKCYVGQTVCFRKRISQHFRALKNNKHCSLYLQNSFNKYGVDSYYVEILEITSKENICSREVYWIEYYRSYDKKFGYNILVNAPSPWYGKRSRSHCENISKALTGKFLSKEHKLNLSISKKGNISNAAKTIYQYDKNMKLINKFSSMIEASNKTGISISTIFNAVNNNLKKEINYIWLRKEVING